MWKFRKCGNLGYILRFARQTGHDTLKIDFVTREAGPPELLAAPISDVPARYIKWFWESVDRQGSDPSHVRTASLTLRYDIRTQCLHFSAPQLMESPYECDVILIDNRGKQYSAHFEGWGFPERFINDTASEKQPGNSGAASGAEIRTAVAKSSRKSAAQDQLLSRITVPAWYRYDCEYRRSAPPGKF